MAKGAPPQGCGARSGCDLPRQPHGGKTWVCTKAQHPCRPGPGLGLPGPAGKQRPQQHLPGTSPGAEVGAGHPLTVSSVQMECTWVPNITDVKMKKSSPSKHSRIRRMTVVGGEKELHSARGARGAQGCGLLPTAHYPPGCLQPCWTWGLLGATCLASRPRRGPPCPAPGCPSLTLVIPCYCLVPWPAGDVCLPVPSTVPGTQKDPEPRHEGLTPPQESLSSSERTLRVAQVEGPQCSPGCEFPRHFCTRHCHPLHLYLLRGETRAGPRIARWLLDLQPAGGSLTAGWALTLVGGEAHRST